MKVTFPHMGRADIPLTKLFEGLGWEPIPAPPITKRTIEIGARHSPEFACLPLKVNIGNMVEGLECGAEAIFMAGGHGPCRFGYYAQVEQAILKDLGYQFEFHVLEPYDGNYKSFFGQLQPLLRYQKNPVKVYAATKLAWEHAKSIDRLTKLLYKTWPKEEVQGVTKRIYDFTIDQLIKANNLNEVAEITNNGIDRIKQVKLSDADPVKIALVGEIYTVLEPYTNFYLEDRLSQIGIEVERSIYISDWLSEQIIPKEIRRRRKIGHHEESKHYARGYLDHFVGGHGIDTIGGTVKYAHAGYDGIIQVLPFTCMPEIVAQSILPIISNDYDIPVLSIVIDEHSGEAGLITRLEAFTDLLRWKRDKRRITVNG